MPSSAPIRRSLFSLPAELLLQIYAHTITNIAFPSSISISQHRKVHRPHTLPLLTCFPGITYVNKTTYRELVPYLLSRTRIIVTDGNDVAFLNAFLQHLQTRSCIISLGCPIWSRMQQHQAVLGRDAHFLHTLPSLREISLTLTTKDILSFRMPEHTPKTIIHIEGCAGKWGLSKLHNLPSLTKLTMELKVDELGSGGVGGFLQLVGWEQEYFNLNDEIVEVRKKEVLFKDLLVVVMTIVRESTVKE